jgi:hypothetical protein
LQHHRRATLIGEKTFGKGSSQILSPLGAGYVLKHTNGYWLTPEGKNLDGFGVLPDILCKSRNLRGGIEYANCREVRSTELFRGSHGDMSRHFEAAISYAVRENQDFPEMLRPPRQCTDEEWLSKDLAMARAVQTLRERLTGTSGSSS